MAIKTEELDLASARQVQNLAMVLEFLVERGHLRATTEYAEAWRRLRDSWAERQSDPRNQDVIEFWEDVTRLFDRAVKRAVAAIDDRSDSVTRKMKGNLEKYRYEELSEPAQAVAVSRTIEALDGLLRDNEREESEKRLEAEKASVQSVVRELAERGFLLDVCSGLK